jgi:hypothetical protein
MMGWMRRRQRWRVDPISPEILAARAVVQAKLIAETKIIIENSFIRFGNSAATKVVLDEYCTPILISAKRMNRVSTNFVDHRGNNANHLWLCLGTIMHKLI